MLRSKPSLCVAQSGTRRRQRWGSQVRWARERPTGRCLAAPQARLRFVKLYHEFLPTSLYKDTRAAILAEGPPASGAQ
jgi:hypothetical protein